jgi:hypothetical protein
MKANNVVRKVITVASVAGLAIAGLVAIPAAHAARSTVVMHETNSFTSLNSGTPDTNLVTNSNVAYLTSMGFNYYDDKKNLVTSQMTSKFSTPSTRDVYGQTELKLMRATCYLVTFYSLQSIQSQLV